MNDKQLTQEEKDAIARATRDAFEARTDRDLRNEPSTIDDFDATELQDSDSYKEFERKQEQSD